MTTPVFKEGEQASPKPADHEARPHADRVPGRDQTRLEPTERGWLQPVRFGLVGVAAAWVVPVATHQVGLDVLLPVLVWVGTASLLRAGRTLIDRLVIAFAVLSGVVSLASLLFSVWPWGLEPVPVAGTALTTLVLVAVVTGRRPRLPARIDPSDVVLAGVSALAAVLLLRPLASGPTSALKVLALGEDAARHFGIYDNIYRNGGLLAFHQSEMAVPLQAGFATYPQGAHVTFALINNFVHSSSSYGTSLTHLHNFALLYALSLALSIACVMWAARWVGGQRLRGWLFLPVAAIVTGFLFFGDGIPIFTHGFVSEVAVFGPFALLIAMLSRPLSDPREQIVTAAALLCTVSMTYYLFLLSTSVAVVIWAIGYRRQLLRHWRWALGAILVGGPVALFAPLVNLRQASSVEQLTREGGVEPMNGLLLTGLLAAVLAGLVGRRTARRSPAWRMMLVWVATNVAYAAALFVATIGHPTRYYYEKSLHELLLVLLVGAGATVLLAQEAIRVPKRRGRRWLAGLAPSAIAAVVLLVGAIFFAGPTAANTGFRHPPNGRSWGESYVRDLNNFADPANAIVTTYNRAPDSDGYVTVLYVNGRYDAMTSYNGTLWLSVLYNNHGRAWRVTLWLLPTPTKSQAELEQFIRDSPHPVRFVTNAPLVSQAVERVRQTDPGIRVEVVPITYP
ncbi:hypothetical protein GCM10010399_58370 [Dactylosporangium fulvum]|uniref:DUF1616 domain-containing protein n=1 Tax=Dactylosporangium fulvum TaxID=53359 RepID=A0ABY5W7C3_9ACTN|nr:DUF1616 domain-containing protein [Dactylosporangium fulvum]UWP86002.1 DUF1616 domain-containing protein [Dactylosporangium fulvum]